MSVRQKTTTGWVNTTGVNVDNYSTDEQVIGKWIDGSTIYRRVFNNNTSINLLDNTWVDSGIAKNNMNIFIKGVITSMSITPVMISVDLGSLSNGNIGINTHRGVVLSPWSLIVEYTKTGV